jgi:polyisoprenoid-binding protein YceI
VHFDASTADCLVFAYREGLLAAVGHDLQLRVGALTVDVGDDDALVARLDARSLRVASTVSAGDARDIERHAARDVLDAERFTEIVFRSSAVTRDGERARVAGTLTLHGVTRPLTFDAVADAERWRAEIRLDQRTFGIRPYSALLGTLRVKPEVLVRLSVPRW